MDATPFSPFVNRRLAKATAVKRRQSELPSDLIDWDAPEIPELDKQRIIYEDYIKELNEDHDIESILNEQIFKIAHDAIVAEFQSKVKKNEEDMAKERSKVNLLLTQIKNFDANLQESNDRVYDLDAKVNDLEKQVNEQRDAITTLESEKQSLTEERTTLKADMEEMAFRNNEAILEAAHNLELYEQQKSEIEVFKKTLESFYKIVQFYKKLASQQEEALQN